MFTYWVHCRRQWHHVDGLVKALHSPRHHQQIQQCELVARGCKLQRQLLQIATATADTRGHAELSYVAFSSACQSNPGHPMPHRLCHYMPRGPSLVSRGVVRHPFQSLSESLRVRACQILTWLHPIYTPQSRPTGRRRQLGDPRSAWSK